MYATEVPAADEAIARAGGIVNETALSCADRFVQNFRERVQRLLTSFASCSIAFCRGLRRCHLTGRHALRVLMVRQTIEYTSAKFITRNGAKELINGVRTRRVGVVLFVAEGDVNSPA